MTSSRQFWNDARIRRIASAVVVAVVLGVGTAHLVVERADSAVRMGDFPVFYAVATLVSEGRGQEVYDLEVLHQRQRAFWPQLEGRFFPFAYPAFYAVLLSPLSLLSPFAAKGAWTLTMAALLLLALWLSRPLISMVREHATLSLALALVCAPLLVGLVGGQNTVVSIVLYVGIFRCLARQDRQGEIWAGVLIGLWLFKPHFGLSSLILILAARRWWVLAGLVPVAALLYALGAYMAGPDWIATWIAALGHYAERDYLANQHQMVCIVGALRALAGALSLPTALTHGLGWLGGAASLLLFGALAWRLWSSAASRTAAGTATDNHAAFAVVAPAMVLTSPHAVVYDLALCMLPFMATVRLTRDRHLTALLLAWLAVAAATALRQVLPVQPLVLASIAVFYLAWPGSSSTHRGSAGEQTPSARP